MREYNQIHYQFGSRAHPDSKDPPSCARARMSLKDSSRSTMRMRTTGNITSSKVTNLFIAASRIMNIGHALKLFERSASVPARLA